MKRSKFEKTIRIPEEMHTCQKVGQKGPNKTLLGEGPGVVVGGPGSGADTIDSR